jgi:metal-responsive CopG/Arc/MetJ family transcriptional regulator
MGSVTKFSISVPKETMSRVDRAAKRLRVTRSHYVSVLLDHVARRERDRSISSAVDKALDAIGPQDLESCGHLFSARRDEGTEW